VTTIETSPLPGNELSEADKAKFFEDGYMMLKSVVSREEAAQYAGRVFDMLPRDFSVPKDWQANAGRFKPYRRFADGRVEDTIDTPELLPLYGNVPLYEAAAQLLGSKKLRIMDGSVGITLTTFHNLETADLNASKSPLSQRLHTDAAVPNDVDDFLFTPEEVEVGGCLYLTDVLPEGGGIHVMPGGHKWVKEEGSAPGGRHLYSNWKRLPEQETIEITGEAGDFALLHHLMPHAASHNRQLNARAALFLRFVRTDHPHGYGQRPARTYNDAQLNAMTPLTRKLVGLDAWED
jgi:ectoine hydroxylase-related dioxygenase (phytanoyl-CoA dioxygenase family)